MPTQDSQELDSTIAALSAGVTGVPLDAGTQEIGKWRSKLQAAANPDLAQIANDLGELERLLGSGGSATEIGLALSRVGQATSNAAATAAVDDPELGPKLQQLGQALAAEGSKLS